jgi:hypothetical protein
MTDAEEIIRRIVPPAVIDSLPPDLWQQSRVAMIKGLAAALAAPSPAPANVERVARAIATAFGCYCPLDKPDGQEYWRKNKDRLMKEASAAIAAMSARSPEQAPGPDSSMVEPAAHNGGVAGSIPAPATTDWKQRPVAFRVMVESRWLHIEDEGEAAETAKMYGVDYQGLYVRDGTPLAFAEPVT